VKLGKKRRKSSKRNYYIIFPILIIKAIIIITYNVDSGVAPECHLCCPPPLPTGKVSSLDSSWGLYLETELGKIKKKSGVSTPCLFPLTRGTDWESGTEWADCLQVWSLCACIHMWGGTVFEKGENWSLSAFGKGYERGKVERIAEVSWWRANFIFLFDFGFSFLFYRLFGWCCLR